MPAVTTTAWHFPVEVGAVPASIDVIGGDALDPSRALTVVDLLRQEANLQFRSYSGSPLQAEINLRGFGSVGTQRALVLVDGIPMNPPDIGGINWLEIPPVLIEQVEVIRGSQTTLYGNHAVGGVIKITTREAPTAPFFRTTLAGGNLGYRDAQLAAGSRLGGGWSAFAAAQHYEEDGYRQHSAQEADSAHFSLGYRPQNARWHASGKVTWVDSYSEMPGPLTTEWYHRDPQTSRGGRTSSHETYLATQGSWTLETEDWAVEVPAGYTHRYVRPDLDGIFTEDTYHIAHAAPRVQRADASGESSAGLDLTRTGLKIDDFQDRSREVLIGKADVSLSTAALYLHRRQELSERWQISGGVRGELARYDYDLVTYDPFSPDYSRGVYREATRDLDGWSANLGLVWQPSVNFRQWLRVDRLYRYPAIDEAFSYRGFPDFDSQLEPEEGYNVELGGEWRQESLTLRLNAFAQWMEGEIDFNGNENVNLADVRRLGLETSARWQADRWSLQLDHTWIDARFTSGPFEGNDRFLVPAHQVTLGGEVEVIETVTLGVGYRYTSSAYEGDDFRNIQPRLPAAAVVDARVRWQPRQALSVYCAAENLFDNRYATVKYSGAWYPAPGIRWRTGAQYSF